MRQKQHIFIRNGRKMQEILVIGPISFRGMETNIELILADFTKENAEIEMVLTDKYKFLAPNQLRRTKVRGMCS